MEIKKILTVRDDRMGDFILTLPAIFALQEAFPKARLTVAVSPSVYPLAVRLLPGKNVFSHTGSFSQFYSFLKSGQFDLIVFFRPRLGTSLAAFLAGVPKRLGTGYRGYSFFYNLKYNEHRHTAEKKEAEYSLSLLKPLGIDTSLRFETIGIDMNEAEEVAKKLGLDLSKNWVAVHPGSGGSSPNWPKKNYIELAQKLSDAGFSILWTGTASELSGINGPGVTLAGETEIWDLACVYSRCRLVVAPSTGPLHLASLVGTPVVGIYSPVRVNSPRRWGPLGPKAITLVPPVPECDCAAGECHRGNCMELLAVETVFQTALNLAVKPAVSLSSGKQV
ncbi:MAG: glycosyltransferase family 9 protein [candidate division Zixibacteria bacterium]|nr:glycosyltransferase family 9 protein [candidate division Zixibacteria bacterium]